MPRAKAEQCKMFQHVKNLKNLKKLSIEAQPQITQGKNDFLLN